MCPCSSHLPCCFLAERVVLRGLPRVSEPDQTRVTCSGAGRGAKTLCWENPTDCWSFIQHSCRLFACQAWVGHKMRLSRLNIHYSVHQAWEQLLWPWLNSWPSITSLNRQIILQACSTMETFFSYLWFHQILYQTAGNLNPQPLETLSGKNNCLSRKLEMLSGFFNVLHLGFRLNSACSSTFFSLCFLGRLLQQISLWETHNQCKIKKGNCV